MLTLPSSVKIFLATSPTDMRKAHDGLYALVTEQLQADAFSGHLFVFVSKRGNRVKILTWDHGGFVLWYKRLEKGHFKLPDIPAGQSSIQLDRAQLSMLLEGIDTRRVRRSNWWEPPRVSEIKRMNTG